MLIWFLFGLYTNWNTARENFAPIGGHMMLFILFLLVGWKLFGPPLQ